MDYEIFNVFDFVLYFVDNEVQIRQKHDQTDQKEQNEPEIWYPEGFAPVPASEPDLTLVPKKSAMKGMGGDKRCGSWSGQTDKTDRPIPIYLPKLCLWGV
jgi:hypothetical protein